MTLAITNQSLMPAMSIQEVVDRRNQIVQFVSLAMTKDMDFGVIPGTGTKPTLLKPGAEKLCSLFGLTSQQTAADAVEDWTGKEHGGEPFFYYRYSCSLYRGDWLVAQAEGSCNSWEKKYRWRKAERKCPNCGKPAIIKGKQEFGGGWLCFGKKGGCGAKFKDGDQAIEGQPSADVPNPDVADTVNTLQKMAQKRALIAATLVAVNASEFFTQDIEDMAIEGQWSEVADRAADLGQAAPSQQEPAKKAEPVKSNGHEPAKLSRSELIKQFEETGKVATTLGINVIPVPSDASDSNIAGRISYLTGRIEAELKAAKKAEAKAAA